MIEVRHSVVIDRPVDEVFAFVGNVANLPRWAAVAVEAHQTTDGPVGVGTHFHAVVEFLGRRVDAEYAVTHYEPSRRVSIRTLSGPFLLDNTYLFVPLDGGTRVDVVSRGKAPVPFRFAERLIHGAIERQFRADHDNLKRVLEAQARPPTA